MIFCLMQNAYTYHMTQKPFERLLERGDWWYPRSKTGDRLRLLLPGEWEPEYVWFFNTTAKVGLKSSSKLPPDPEYVKHWLEARNPDVVVATGAQAEECVTPLWDGNLVVVPHPTYRCLTNRLYRYAARTVDRLNNGGTGRIAFRQERGYHRTEAIET